MVRKRTGQLELSLFPAEEHPPVVLTRALRTHPARDRIIERVTYVRRFFPELAGRTIKVGLTRAASGMAVPGGSDLWINPSAVSYHTIAHEMVHLLQGERGIRSSERSCDLYALARHWTLNDTPPYYLRIPMALIDRKGGMSTAGARLLYEIALQALTERERGCRNYLVLFEQRLASIVGGPPTAHRERRSIRRPPTLGPRP